MNLLKFRQVEPNEQDIQKYVCFAQAETEQEQQALDSFNQPDGGVDWQAFDAWLDEQAEGADIHYFFMPGELVPEKGGTIELNGTVWERVEGEPKW